jgi:hypothetical protein
MLGYHDLAGYSFPLPSQKIKRCSGLLVLIKFNVIAGQV